MPTITNPGVIEQLVTEYLLKDCNQAAAGLAIGYSENYVYNGEYSKLFERDDVLAEIRRQRAELQAKTGFSVEQMHAQIQEDRDFARSLKQPSAASTSSNQLMRLHNMDQVASTDAVQIVINPPTSPKRVESEIIENEM
jgi:hypothetical protein